MTTVANKYIAIEGNIGAGKTTLSTMLAKHLDAVLIHEEFENNPFLAPFYENPKNQALALELSFLVARYHQLQTQHSSESYTIADYVVDKCLIFSDNNLEGPELSLYHSIYQALASQLRKPDLILFLDCPTHKLQHHIQKRGRTYELEMKTEYLDNLRIKYLQYWKAYHHCPVLIIESEFVDFVEDPTVLSHFVGLLQHEWPKGVTYLTSLELISP